MSASWTSQSPTQFEKADYSKSSCYFLEIQHALRGVVLIMSLWRSKEFKAWNIENFICKNMAIIDFLKSN